MHKSLVELLSTLSWFFNQGHSNVFLWGERKIVLYSHDKTENGLLATHQQLTHLSNIKHPLLQPPL